MLFVKPKYSEEDIDRDVMRLSYAEKKELFHTTWLSNVAGEIMGWSAEQHYLWDCLRLNDKEELAKKLWNGKP